MTRARNSANLASHGNLFVDITNDRTGIGSVVPAQNLHVAGTAGFHADTTFTGDLYNATWDRSDNSLKFVDNAKIKVGTGGDLEIFHTGAGSYIHDTGQGNLHICSNQLQIINGANTEIQATFQENGAVSLYHDNVKKFETTAYGTNTTGTAVNDGLVVAGVATVTTMNVTGVLTYDDVTSVDSVGIVTARQGVRVTADGSDSSNYVSVGASDDLKLYHTGSHSFIDDTGTGNLYIQSNHVNIDSKNGEQFINCIQDGAVELYHNNSKKFETTNIGANVIGNFVADLVDTIDPDSYTNHFITGNIADGSGWGAYGIAFGQGTGRMAAFGVATHLYMAFGDGSNANSLSTFQRVTTSGAVELYHNGSKKFETDGNGITVQGNINMATDSTLFLGVGNDFKLFHNGTSNFIRSANGNIRIDDNSGVLNAQFIPAGASELYHNGSKKLETTTYGIDVTGTTGTDGLAVSGISTFANDVSIASDIMHTGDTNNRIRLGTAHQVFITNSSERLRITSGGDIYIRKAETGASKGSAALEFYGTTSGSLDRDQAKIESSPHTSNTNAGNLDFYTQTVAGNNLSLRMRIDGDGRVMIGTTTEGETTADNLTIADSGHCGITIRSGTSSEGNIFFSDGTSGDAEYRGMLRYEHNNDAMVIKTATAERVRIDSSGRLLVGRTTGNSANLLVQSGAQVFAGANNGNSSCLTMDYNTANGAGRIMGHASSGGMLQFFTNASGAGVTPKLQITSTGTVLHGSGAIATQKASNGGFDISCNTHSLVIGADSNSGNLSQARTNNAIKDGRIGHVHYTNAEEPIGLFRVSATSSENIVFIGGGSSLFNAATSLQFYTGANNTTTNGTERVRITSSGNFGVGTNSPNRIIHAASSGHPYIKCESTNTTGAGIEVKDTAENWLIQADGGVGPGLAFYDLGRTAYRFIMGNAGQLGIGGANYGSSGQVLTSGGASSAPSWTTITGTTINNNANNRVITGSGTANTLEAESGLLWDGTTLTVSGSTNQKIILQGATHPYIHFYEGTTAKAFIQWHADGYMRIKNDEDDATIRLKDNIEFSPNDSTYYKMWHAGNDGSGSGLDADTLDGVNGANYVRTNQNTTVTSDLFIGGGAGGLTVNGASDIRFTNGNWTGNVSGNTAKIQHHANYLYIAGGSSGIIFRENNDNRWIIDGSGHFRPGVNNTYDIGSTSFRVRNLYTQDLQLSNEAQKDEGGNDVDGTWGDWTLQEGEEKIYMINNRTGKKYSLIMKEEV